MDSTESTEHGAPNLPAVLARNPNMSETAIRALPQSSASALLGIAGVLVGGFLAFGLGVAFGVPSDRIVLLGVSILLGTLISLVFAIDRIRRRENRNLLLSIFSFAYLVYFVLPALVFYVGQGGYDP